MRQIGDYVWKLTRSLAPKFDGKYSIYHDLDSYVMFKVETGQIVWVGEHNLLGADGYRAARKALDDRKLMKYLRDWS
jgi:hypothetical protein